MAAMDPSVTYLVKVDDDSYVHMARLLMKLKKMPREKLFFGYMEKAGLCTVLVAVRLQTGHAQAHAASKCG